MAGLGRRTHYRKHVTDAVLNDFPEPTEHESIAVIVATRGSNQFDIRLPHSSPDAPTELAILPTKFRKLVWLKRNDFVIVQTTPPPSSSEVTETTEEEDDERDQDKANNDNEAETSTNEKKIKNNDKSASSEPVDSAGEGGEDHENVGVSSNVMEETGSIRCMITHILYSEQIKHLRAKGLWPTDDSAFDVDNGSHRPTNGNNNTSATAATEDGIVYNQGYGDDDYYNNDSDDDNDPNLFVNTNRISRIAIEDDSSSSEEEG